MLRVARNLGKRTGALGLVAARNVQKTTVKTFDLFESQQADLHFSGYNAEGFQIQGCDVYYSLFVLPHNSYLWNVPSIRDLKPEHLSILELIKPIGRDPPFFIPST